MSNDDETNYRGLVNPELARAVAAVLGTFPGAQLVGVAPNPRPRESWLELDGEEQLCPSGQQPAQAAVASSSESNEPPQQQQLAFELGPGMRSTNLDCLTNLRPPLKWAGGKSWLVPHLSEYWRRHAGRRLLEPFCGGLGVTLGLCPGRALLNDINPHLVNFYAWLKRGLRVDEKLEFAYHESLYYQHRAHFNELITNGGAESAEVAALFYYLNRTCFNGLCRFNQSGEFNVPFGQYRQINYRRDFSEYSRALAGWTFRAGDFECVPLEAADFVYADPPYDVEFRSYSKEGFSWGDQVRLAEWLAKHEGPVVASNQATERILLLYRKLGFTVCTLEAPRRINSTGDRTPALEMLALRGMY